MTDERFAYFHDVCDEQAKRTFLCIPTPGDVTTIVDRPMKERDKAEYPAAWDAYEAGRENRPEGTPIESWPDLSPQMVHEFKGVHIQTVEQFLNLNATASRKIMGYHSMSRKAAAFLQSLKESKLRYAGDAIARLEARVAALEANASVHKPSGRQ